MIDINKITYEVIGLKRVIKRQKGEILEHRNYNERVKFLCPICKRMKTVETECQDTQSALHAIGKNPIYQLICVVCDERIWRVNWDFNHIDRIESNPIIMEIYRELGWID